MKKTAQVICIFLTVMLIMPSTLSVFAEGSTGIIIASGYCGKPLNIFNDDESFNTEFRQNLRWSLDSNGTLTISGSGEMIHFFDELSEESVCATPWDESEVKSLIIEEGVESIGFGAFEFCDRLKSVRIPASMKKICRNSFPSLKSIELPDSVDVSLDVVNRIENVSVFRGDYDKAGSWMSGELYTFWGGMPDDDYSVDIYNFVKNLTIQEGVRYLPNGIANCIPKESKSMIIPGSVTNFEWRILYGYTELTDIYFGAEKNRMEEIVQQYNSGKPYHYQRLGYYYLDEEAYYDEWNDTYYRTRYYPEDEGLSEQDINNMMKDPSFEFFYEDVFRLRDDIKIHHVDYIDGRYIENVAASEATETEHGYTAGVYCVDTDTWLSGHEVIHNTLGEMTVLREPTETESGECIIVCTVCGESGLYAMDPIIHDPEDPDDPSNDEPEDGEPNDDNGFFSNIRRMMRTIIDFFLRILRWLGGKK